MEPDRRAARSLRKACMLRGCGDPQQYWTNYMEPLCKDHFFQRQCVQELMIMLSGRGSWGALIVFNNPEAFRPYCDETV